MELPIDIDLLLIGKTSNGRSALGNTILRRKAFLSKSSQESVTKKVDYHVSNFNNFVIKVFDGPGVGYTCLDDEHSKILVIKAMEFAITTNPRGYHAFLLVTEYGGRFTDKDQDTVTFLKRIFGENFVKNFCILVLTNGDRFESEDNGLTFGEWCKEQTGVFKELLEECCHRVILFDNRTKDEAKKMKQLTDLIEMVDKLRWRDLRYTDENFQKAREAREKLIVEAKRPRVCEETMYEISLILQKLQWTHENVDQKDKRSYFDDLQQRAKNLYDNIQVQDKETGALHDIIHTTKSVQVTIADEIKISQIVIQEREKEKTQAIMAKLAGQIEECEQGLIKHTLEDERRSKVLRQLEKK